MIRGVEDMRTEQSNKYIIVKESEIHNKGIFARIDIPENTRIIEYEGERISKKEGTRRVEESFEKHKKDPKYNAGTYIFELDDNYDVDGDVPDNDAKYINHSCDPNCEFRMEEDKIFIYSTKLIKKDEELHYNYGFEIDPDDIYDFKDYPCNCGSPKCAGYMLAEHHWPKMKELLDKDHLKNSNP